VAYPRLSESQSKQFDLILDDLELIFKKTTIADDQLEDLFNKLKSEEVLKYLKDLHLGSKKEASLSGAFFAGISILSKFLTDNQSPEVRLDENHGFVDYQIGAGTRSALLELKPLFEKGSNGLNQIKFDYAEHKEQILTYLEADCDFVILTNLKEWYFFNTECNSENFKPFYSVTLFDFVNEFVLISDIHEYLERRELETRTVPLDKEFFLNLKNWVEKLNQIKYNDSQRCKTEIVIGIINKLVFIKTLDAYGVIPFKWLKTTWDYANTSYSTRSKFHVLKEFFNQIHQQFESYDTELFERMVLDEIYNEEENFNNFYNILTIVLGTKYYQSQTSVSKGVIQFNFRHINEDVFGKAYENFLAEIRHDEAIYYTPSYVSEHIVDETVGSLFNEFLNKINLALKNENFEETKKLINQMLNVKVLDPSCGSGSFLIKATKKILHCYESIKNKIDEMALSYNPEGSLIPPKENIKKLITLEKFSALLHLENKRDLVCSILIKHIYGNDLDARALEVAKLNLWLEAIKLAPIEFKPENIPKDVKRVLPDLVINFSQGDGVVGLPDELVLDILSENKEKIISLNKFRDSYIGNLSNFDYIKKIEQIKNELQKKLDLEFKNFLQEQELFSDNVSDFTPLYWPLNYWHMYFKENGELKEKADQGADIIIGNPPYKQTGVLNRISDEYSDFLDKIWHQTATKGYDLAVIFAQRGYELLKNSGLFGYIMTNKFMTSNYGVGLRRFLYENRSIKKIINFGSLQLFLPAKTYTALVFLQKTQNKQFLYGKVRILQKTKEQLESVNHADAEDDYEDYTIRCGMMLNENFTEKSWVFVFKNEIPLIEKLEAVPNKMKQITGGSVNTGFGTSADEIYFVNEREQIGALTTIYSEKSGQTHQIESEILKPYIKGVDVRLCEINYKNRLVIYPYQPTNDGFELIPEQTMQRNYPHCYQYLRLFETELRARESGKMDHDGTWYAFNYPRNRHVYPNKKIIWPTNRNSQSFTYDDFGFYYSSGSGGVLSCNIVQNFNINNYFLIGLLNSSLLGMYYIQKIGTPLDTDYFTYDDRYIKQIPIKIPTVEQNHIEESISSSIQELIILKKIRKLFFQKWKEISESMKTRDFSLFDILLNELELHSNNDPNTMFSRLAWYSNPKINETVKNCLRKLRKTRIKDLSSDEFSELTELVFKNLPDSVHFPMEREHINILLLTVRSFYIEINLDNNTLRIFGRSYDQFQPDFPVLILEFNDNNLMQYFYASIKNFIDMKGEKKNLLNLLNKTIIPLRGPNPTETSLIAENISNELRSSWQQTNTENVPLNILEIENAINNAIISIEGNVFKLYDLEINEINEVMLRSDLNNSQQGKILEFFNSL